MALLRLSQGPAVVLTVLFLLVQSAELAGAEGANANTNTAAAPLVLGETNWAGDEASATPAPAVTVEPATPAPGTAGANTNITGGQSQLISDVESIDPNIAIDPTELTVPGSSLSPNVAQAMLTQQLSAVTDENGDSVISGVLHDPDNATVSVETDLPGDDSTAFAMMSGHKKGDILDDTKPEQVKYRPIPYFKFSHDGQTSGFTTQAQCEALCTDDSFCLSFSYNKLKSTCIVSKSCVQYDLEFNFFAKKGDKDEGAVGFRDLGSMKYLMLGKGSSGVNPFVGKTQLWCREKCARVESCNSFCFRKRDNLCLTSSQELGYEQEWNYYEKAGAAAKALAMRNDAEGYQGGDHTALSAEMIANGTATKQTDGMPGLSGLPGVAGAVDKAPGLSQKLNYEDETSLTEEQIAYLQANKMSDKAHETAGQVVKAALQARTAELTTEQQARIALAQRVAEAAEKKAEEKATEEARGKKLFEGEMRATDGKIAFEMEKAGKDGWKTGEKSAKTEESQREITQKETEADTARKAREKTSAARTDVSTKVLEASDQVKSMETRQQLYKEAVERFRVMDKAVTDKIEGLSKDATTATGMIAGSKDTSKLTAAKTTEDAQKKIVAEQLVLQGTSADNIASDDAKIPDLMKVIADEGVLKANGAGELTQAQLAQQGATTAPEIATTAQAVADANAKIAAADGKITTAQNEMTRLKDNISEEHKNIAKSKDIEQTADAARIKANFEWKSEDEHLKKLKSDGDIQLSSSVFKKRQEVNNEFQVKTQLAKKMGDEFEFEESDTKKKLKLTELNDRLAELNAQTKSQNIEQKTKVAVRFQEKASKAQQVVDNKRKAAKSDEERGIKMLTTAKLAATTAITMSQKVSAATQESEAGQLKASAEQQIMGLAPHINEANAREQEAEDKLEALKELFGDDEAGYKKAMAKFNLAAGAFNKAKMNGAKGVVNEKEAADLALEEESAMMAGINGISKGYSGTGTASQRASNALNDISEKDQKLGKQSDVLNAIGKNNAALSVESHLNKERDIKSEIDTARTKETAIKRDIAEKSGTLHEFMANQKKLEEERTQELDTKESRRKQTAQNSLSLAAQNTRNAQNAHIQEMHIREMNTKSQAASDASRAAAAAARQPPRNEREFGCFEDEHGVKLDSFKKESCVKTKAGELASEEAAAKQDGATQESKIKLDEKATKDTEIQAKDERKRKTNANEVLQKTQAQREKDRKATLTEDEQKEDKKKHDAAETSTKENHSKEMERAERATKAEATVTAKAAETERTTKERETKIKERNTKAATKAVKEKSIKDNMSEKDRKKAQRQMRESGEKQQVVDDKERTDKDKEERDGKEMTRKDGIRTTTEKDTKEKGEKATAESTQKAVTEDNNRIAQANENDTKEKDTKRQQETAVESGQKGNQNEVTTKNGERGEKTAAVQSSEATLKNNANEGTNKISGMQTVPPPSPYSGGFGGR